MRGATIAIERSETKKEFQSTPPVRGATVFTFKFGVPKGISIHAPRAGGDGRTAGGAGRVCKISIHAPRAGGDDECAAAIDRLEISIHAPRAGGDRFAGDYANAGETISIHAPRAGGDRGAKAYPAMHPIFQSTPPVRGAT